MSTVLTKKADQAWQELEGILTISSEADCRRAGKILDQLVDEVRGDESHPRAGLMDTLATLVHAWEEAHHSAPRAEPRKVLAFLMEEHGLNQKDLKEVGSQGIVSEILSGQRSLNVRQIRGLARRFHVSPAVFLT